ncbi:nuclear transport factor 2 family protein [Lutibacter holmesii]|uniref:Nuclear transport factor 2 family protein n=1 Tax=Lutibacter holmesii TaxID=1137985 RepID=A0ABW3WU63_9FLAO
MKKISVIIFVLIVCFSCTDKEKIVQKVEPKQEVAAINKVLNSWHLDAAETNFENYFEAMSSKSVFVGTDAAEVWDVQEFKAFSKPYFDKGTAWDFKAVDRNVYLNSDGKIAWFDELLDTWMGVCRGSGVLKKTNETWKIEHYVLSLTVPNDNIQEVMKVNKVKDSLFLKNYKN